MQPLSFDFEHIDRGLAYSLCVRIRRHLEGYALSSFMLGVTYPFSASEAERANYKKDFQAELTRQLENAFEAHHSPNDPDVQLLVEFDRGLVSFRIQSLFIGGRYTKESRSLAQTVHFCMYCKGRGCARCQMKGRTEFLSVQEKIAPFFEAVAQASANVFHGAGREDVDVRMLGRGRPFVLELIEPRVRAFDLYGLGLSVNAANRGACAVHDLFVTNRAEVAKIKEAAHEKIYRAVVESVEPLEAQSVAHLTGQSFLVAQRTPKRVSHRRVDLIRKRQATILKALVLSKHHFEIEVRTDAGLYVKEFVSGDNGRSEPSVSSLLGVECKCAELDVLEVVSKP